MAATMTSRIGHFTHAQMLTVVEPTPITSPTAAASVPVRTIATATRASNSVNVIVTSNWSGRNCQNGLPSRVS